MLHKPKKLFNTNPMLSTQDPMVTEADLDKFFGYVATSPAEKKYQREIYELFGSRIIAFSPALAKTLKSTKAGLFLAQLLYWHGRGRKKGWVYKTLNEFQDETSLSRAEQDRAIRILQNFKILEVKLAGVPPVRHFRVDLEAVRKLQPNNTKVAN